MLVIFRGVFVSDTPQTKGWWWRKRFFSNFLAFTRSGSHFELCKTNYPCKRQNLQLHHRVMHLPKGDGEIIQILLPEELQKSIQIGKSMPENELGLCTDSERVCWCTHTRDLFRAEPHLRVCNTEWIPNFPFSTGPDPGKLRKYRRPRSPAPFAST